MNQVEIHIEIMRAAGLGDGEIERLARLKQRVSAGRCDDLTIEYKRLIFVKYLHSAGRLHE